MLKLHNLNASRSFRIIWALEILGVPYELVNHTRSKEMLAPTSLKKIHPLGKSPVIEDDGKIIAESAVILNYLADKFDSEQKYRPTNCDAKLEYDYWMHYAEGSFMPLLVMHLVIDNLHGKQVPFIARPIGKIFANGVAKQFLKPNIVTHLEFLNQHLANNQWMNGEQFTFADVMMSYPLVALKEFINRYHLEGSHVERLLQDYSQIESYQKALAIHGDFIPR